jgi:GNAT superfamily N-acetyltransferase
VARPADVGLAGPVAPFEIRDAVPGDIDRLRAVFRRSALHNDGDRDILLAHPDALELSDVAVREGRTRVAVRDGVIVGFASWLSAGDALELEDLFVDPAWMRRGAGRELVLDLVAIARDRGARRIEVTANQHAAAFYASVGFVARGEVETTFSSALRMFLDLTA